LSDLQAAWEAEDVDGIMAVYSDDYSGEGGRSGLRAFYSDLAAKGLLQRTALGIEECEIVVDGDRATAGPVTYTSPDNRHVSSYTMKREGGGVWRIVGDVTRSGPASIRGEAQILDLPYLTSNGFDPSQKMRECYLFAALEAVVQYAGEDVDYNYLMGSSGCAFRLWVNPGGSTEASLPDTSSLYHLDRALKTIGFSKKLDTSGGWEDADGIQEAIRESIDKGIPPIIMTGMAGVVFGYTDEKFIWQAMHNPIEESEIGDHRIIILEKTGEPLDRKDAAMRSLATGLQESRHGLITFKGEERKSGIAAYDAWVKTLRTPVLDVLKTEYAEFKANALEAMANPQPDNEGFRDWLRDSGFGKYLTELDVEDITIGHDSIAYMEHWHDNTWPYEALLDARTAAAKYLKQVAGLFKAERRTKIEALAGKFSEIEGALRDSWMWMPLRFWVHAEEGTIWSPAGTVDGILWTDEMRSEAADTLERVKQMEVEAYGIMGEIIGEEP